MADELEDDLTKLGVSASLARRYMADQRDFVDYLAAALEKVLPGEVQVERRGGLFADKRIHALRVHVGHYLSTLPIPHHGPPPPTRTEVDRGIMLKTAAVPYGQWLSLLG